jgi:uncharacterized membrane protein
VKTRLSTLLDLLRTSYWFVPALMALAAGALALLVLGVDHREPEWIDPARWWLYGGDHEGARSVLGVIVGSMISVISVVFSITIVTLTLASGQFGSRILRSFLRDTGNQITLGTFIATFTYALVVLGTVQGEEGREFVPALAVTVGMLLVFASLGVLIFFIHHVATSIQADIVIRGVSMELRDAIERLYPEGLGEEIGAQASAPPGAFLPPRFEEEALEVQADRADYLQAVDEESLMQLAEEEDLVVRIRKRPGDFVMEGEVLAEAYRGAESPEALLPGLRRLFVQGKSRTMSQDAAFGIDQLVEIAVRALSTGINDPSTAATCVDRLSAALRVLASRQFPEPARFDAEGRMRVLAVTPTFSGLLDNAFDRIRANAGSSAAVLSRILEGIEKIAEGARTEEHLAALRRHADRTLEVGEESLSEAIGLPVVRQRHAAAVRALVTRETGGAKGVAEPRDHPGSP